MSSSKCGQWKPIKTFHEPDRCEVDVWLSVPASPLSMGMSDAWRVIDAWRMDGKWFHYHEGKERELVSDYITHWMPIPRPPNEAGQDDAPVQDDTKVLGRPIDDVVKHLSNALKLIDGLDGRSQTRKPPH